MTHGGKRVLKGSQLRTSAEDTRTPPRCLKQSLHAVTKIDLPEELFQIKSSPCSSCSLLGTPLWYLNAIPN